MTNESNLTNKNALSYSPCCHHTRTEYQNKYNCYHLIIIIVVVVVVVTVVVIVVIKQRLILSACMSA